MVCGWFGWFLGSLDGFWVVSMVFGWFQNLQLMIYKHECKLNIVLFRQIIRCLSCKQFSHI